MATPPVIAGAASASADVSPAALKSKSIGTQPSTIHANYLEKFYKDSTIKLYPRQDEPNQDLASGRLDCGIAEADAFLVYFRFQALIDRLGRLVGPVRQDLGVEWLAPTCKPWDHVVLRADMDCIVVLSACPQDILPINGDALHPMDVAFSVR